MIILPDQAAKAELLDSLLGLLTKALFKGCTNSQTALVREIIVEIAQSPNRLYVTCQFEVVPHRQALVVTLELSEKEPARAGKVIHVS